VVLERTPLNQKRATHSRLKNWLPIERGDLDLSPQLRVYVPDLEAMKTWVAPKAEKL